MRKYRNTLFSVGFTLLAGVFAFGTSSCKEDLCKATVCAYEGTCNEDGSCTCLIGYEGERCETISKDKFKGAWTVTEKGTITNAATYASSIEDRQGHGVDDVIIRNFNNKFNKEIFAKVEMDTIFIPSQSIELSGETYTIHGKGYAEPETFYGLHGKIIFSYTITYPNNSQDKYGEEGAENHSIWVK